MERENFQEYVSWQWHCNEHEEEGEEDDNVVMYIIIVVYYISPSSMLFVVDELLSLIFIRYNFCSCLCMYFYRGNSHIHACLHVSDNIYKGNVVAQHRVDDDNDTIDATAKLFLEKFFKVMNNISSSFSSPFSLVAANAAFVAASAQVH